MKVSFSDKALKQLKKLSREIQKRIFDFMTDVSTLDNPRIKGKALVGNLRGFWRYRVSDYRIICRIIDSEVVIIVVEVGNRREIYK